MKTSVGYHCYDPATTDLETFKSEVYTAADEALYVAKQNKARRAYENAGGMVQMEMKI